MAKRPQDRRRRGEVTRLLPLLYRRSLAHFGAQHWWPGETREEVILGAVLTQNTAWSNVERALGNLRTAGIPVTLRAVGEMEPGRLANLIRPVGYFSLKAKRLQAVAKWFVETCGGEGAKRRGKTVNLGMGGAGAKGRDQGRGVRERHDDSRPLPESAARRPKGIPNRRRFPEKGESVDLSPLLGLRGAELEALRQDLLEVYGVGPETADSILLYALDGEAFVVDAYTLRIGERHGLFAPRTPYEEVKRMFEEVLGRDADLFNDYHAQLVAIGKHYCKTRKPLCEGCPLGSRECFASGRRWLG